MTQHLLKNSFLRGVLFLLLCAIGLGNAWGEEVTVTFDASKQGYTNGQVIDNVTITDSITISFTKGTVSPAYYTSGTAIRCYAKGGFTITSTIGDITKIVFTYGSSDGSNAITANVGSFDKNTWTGQASAIKFSIGGTKGHRRIKTITVTYQTSTTPDAPTPELESIDFEAADDIVYYVGETVTEKGLTVTANYTNGTNADVTKDVENWSFTPEKLTEEGNIEVTATAEYQNKSVSYTYNVIVTKNPKITDYTKLEDGKKYYIGATLSNGTDYYFSTTYTNITETVKGVAQTDKANANILTAIANSSNKTKWAFQFENGYYLSLKDSQDNGMVRIIAQKTYWVLSNTTKGLVNMTTNGFCLQRNNSSTTTNFGSYKNTQTDIWFIEVPTYDVEISSAGLATFCLPYNATIPDGLTAYTATDNGKSVTLKAKQGEKIAAGEGVVLKGDKGTYTFVAAEGSVNRTAENQMVGVTEDTKLTADKAYMLTRKKEDGSIAFRLLKTDYTLGANRAYLKVDGSANTRELIPALWDDNATGIDNIAKDEATATGAIYNLAGQKLMRAQKGINIINGKLVIK